MDKYAEIRNRFEESADQENAVKMAKYMRNLFSFLRDTDAQAKEALPGYPEGRKENKDCGLGIP